MCSLSVTLSIVAPAGTALAISKAMTARRIRPPFLVLPAKIHSPAPLLVFPPEFSYRVLSLLGVNVACVSPGEIAVGVGGTDVEEAAGTEVAVGGTDVDVGGTVVAVAVGTEVGVGLTFVAVAVGTGVDVGGLGVGVSVGTGVVVGTTMVVDVGVAWDAGELSHPTAMKLSTAIMAKKPVLINIFPVRLRNVSEMVL